MLKNFRLIDNILGWAIFAVAAVVYCLTIEPTASFWDCPEFIATGYKLEVGHPPGAPFFMLTANLFSQFASDTTEVARMVNTMSALLSASCILFLFWSISHLTRKLICDGGIVSDVKQLIAIEASAMVGALIYTFSDTFWFSAVEGEVYAYSSAFTAVVFWLILKWEDNADKPHSDRWLVLIFYMTGLSIGVHLLNLLCIPAIVLVYYYKKVPNADLKGSLFALAVSFVLVAAVLYGVVPGIVTVGGWSELFFVNVLGCPFNTGVVIYLLLLVGTVLWAIYETYNDHSQKRQNIAFVASVALLGVPFINCEISGAITGIVVLGILWFILRIKREGKVVITTRIKNTALLCMLMLMIGYSSYAVIVIRSMANPPMDQNSPEDIFTLGSYLSRDQYGDTPLVYGEAFSSDVCFNEDGTPILKKGSPVYSKREKKSADEKDSYFILTTKDKLTYENCMLFPRMHDYGHASDYFRWMGGEISGVTRYTDDYGRQRYDGLPSFFENLKFFVTYQCNFMYWRYFMWNFVGRQNDLQSGGELEHGNWITGISFIDNLMLGDQDLLPDELKENKGHNVFYCLPLLLGLIGLFWQAFKGDKGIQQFWVVFFLFFMTGLAIVLYLNQTPGQPRERDYAYAGSFYAFAIWCGMGVAAILDLIKQYLKKDTVVIAAAVSIICLLVPVQMASQTWDDHDRSGRYTCRDFGQNYLNSMDKGTNPIIFTNGDNDTFPLWYNQDVEGVGTDARVCNLSYLSTDWYIDQMIRAAYDSPALPITWSRYEYCSGTNDRVYVRAELKDQIREFYAQHPEQARKELGDDPFEVHNIMKYWVRGGYKTMEDGSHVIPTDTIYINVDADAVKRSKMLIAGDSIPQRMAIPLQASSLDKSKLMMLEILANTNWVRPVYVATTVGSDNFFTLGNNFVQEGLVNRITPFNTTDSDLYFDSERVYNNVMTRFKFGGLEKPGLYIDETTMRMCYTHKRLFAMLAGHLVNEGKTDKAKKVLAYMERVMPEYNVPSTNIAGGMEIARSYAALGMKKEAVHVLKNMQKRADQYLRYFLSHDSNRFSQSIYDCLDELQVLANGLYIAQDVDQSLYKSYFSDLTRNLDIYLKRGGIMPGPDEPGLYGRYRLLYQVVASMMDGEE